MNISRLTYAGSVLLMAGVFLFTDNICSAAAISKNTLRPPLTLSDKRIAEAFARYHAIYRDAGGMEAEGYMANPSALYAVLGEPYKLVKEALSLERGNEHISKENLESAISILESVRGYHYLSSLKYGQEPGYLENTIYGKTARTIDEVIKARDSELPNRFRDMRENIWDIKAGMQRFAPVEALASNHTGAKFLLSARNKLGAAL